MLGRRGGHPQSAGPDRRSCGIAESIESDEKMLGQEVAFSDASSRVKQKDNFLLGL